VIIKIPILFVRAILYQQLVQVPHHSAYILSLVYFLIIYVEECRPDSRKRRKSSLQIDVDHWHFSVILILEICISNEGDCISAGDSITWCQCVAPNSSLVSKEKSWRTLKYKLQALNSGQVVSIHCLHSKNCYTKLLVFTFPPPAISVVVVFLSFTLFFLLEGAKSTVKPRYFKLALEMKNRWK